MAAAAKPSGLFARLFTHCFIDPKEEIEEKLERCYNSLTTLITGVSDKEAHDALVAAVSKDNQSHEDVSIGLVVAILVDPASNARYYRDLTFVSRDGLVLVVTRLNQIVEKYLRLQDGAKLQLLWLIKEMIKNNIAGVDGICYNLLRQIAGGDVSTKNVWLAENLIDVFTEHRVWLEKFPVLLATVVYTYLRLIVDHAAATFHVLRQREIDLTISLMRAKFTDCMIIGRDLVRLLQNVARLPEFEKLWKDILHNPTSLCPTFTGLLQLMAIRTSRKFLLSRITPDMAEKIYFLTTYVKFGQHKRYQEWFQKQYLSTPESQSLRCDLIRFIIGVIHPSNELLCSDIIPRWAVIGWLLTTCTSNVAASNAKLSLFYDWLLYDPVNDDGNVSRHSVATAPVLPVSKMYGIANPSASPASSVRSIPRRWEIIYLVGGRAKRGGCCCAPCFLSRNERILHTPFPSFFSHACR